MRCKRSVIALRVLSDMIMEGRSARSRRGSLRCREEVGSSVTGFSYGPQGGHVR